MLDLTLIRKRLARIDQTCWWAACAPEEGDTCPQDREFVRYAPTDIAVLLAEVERLRSGNASLQEEIAILTGPMLCDECDALISLGEE